MNPDIFTDYLRSLGYRGVYSRVFTNNETTSTSIIRNLHTQFWTKERPISLSIYCHRQNASENEIANAFIKILAFAETDYLKNTSDNSFFLAAQCMAFLLGTGYFDSVRLIPTPRLHIVVAKHGVEYRVEITATSQDVYDRDADDEIDLDSLNKDVAEMLKFNCEVAFARDLRSLSAKIRHKEKMHTLQITSFYSFYDIWSVGAALFINCYQTMLTLVGMKNSIRFLQQNGFYDISEVVCIDGSTEYEVFWEGKKYQIKIVVEDALPCFDNMDGAAFERFCAGILSKNGFKNIKLTQGSGDQGVDIIAHKDDIKYGIQCKCYSSDVGNKAVQEVFAGKTFYQCHVGVVLTNRDFTKSAIELARHNGIILWNRTKLLQLIDKANRAME